MHRKTIAAITLTMFCLAFLATAVWAGDIKSRMRERLPAIVKMKDQGIVGENNQGFLTALKPAGDKQAVIDAENKDRRKIYSAIAKKQGTSAKLVGQRRAMQIFEKADAGTMLQNKKGKWIKKK